MITVTQQLLQSVPTQLLQPSDGMSVTADVWRIAHEYHIRQMQAHALICHGGGIVGGLKVRAHDTGNAVYVTPGIAIDGKGRVMVLQSQEQIDLEGMHGVVRIVLEYKERGPVPFEDNARMHFDNDVKFMQLNVHPQAKIEAGDEIWVELGRIDRASDTNPVKDAINSDWPTQNEIDCRFRRVVGGLPPPLLRKGILVMGGDPKPAFEGLSSLARVVNHHGQLQVILHKSVSLDSAGLQACDMLYLSLPQNAQLSQAELDAFKQYTGEHLAFVECANEMTAQPLLRNVGVAAMALPDRHALMTNPYLFTALPMSQGSVKASASGSIVLSTADCATAWQGGGSAHPVDRETIRVAHEWGENLLMYALSILS